MNMTDQVMPTLKLVFTLSLILTSESESRNQNDSECGTTSSSLDYGSMLPVSVEGMRGKTLLMLGCRKTDAIEISLDLGIEIVIVTSRTCRKNSTYGLFPNIFHYDLSDNSRDREHTFNIVSLLNERHISVDGCCTFEDDLTVLAAMIAEELDLVSPEVEGVLCAKKKSLFFWKMTTKTNVNVDATLYAVPTYQIQNEQNLTYFLRKMHFPLILKLEHGSGSAGVKVVKTEEECINSYRSLRIQSEANKRRGGNGFGFGDTYVLMEFIKGSEHSVDIVMFKGELIAVFIKDKLTTMDGRFMESFAIMPSGLSLDHQEKITLASYQTCLKIGLHTGVFNLDVIFSTDGPKVIEVNARMGGNYHRDWINHLYKFDLAVALYQVSLNIRPRFRFLGSCGVIAGTMMTNSSHYEILDRQSFKDQVSSMVEQGLIIFKKLRNSITCGSGDFEKTRANLAVISETREEAMLSLLRVTRNFHINDSYYIINTLFEIHDKHSNL